MRWAWRGVVVLPYAAMFVLNLLWLRDPDPPGPRWQSVLVLIGMTVLGVVTVRRWRREDATAIS